MKAKTKRVAIIALRAYAQHFAFDAALFNQGMADHPSAVNAAQKHAAALEAIADLEGECLPKPKTQLSGGQTFTILTLQ